MIDPDKGDARLDLKCSRSSILSNEYRNVLHASVQEGLSRVWLPDGPLQKLLATQMSWLTVLTVALLMGVQMHICTNNGRTKRSKVFIL